MTAFSQAIPPASVVPEGGEPACLPVLAIDRSCRLAVLFLFSAALFWLGLGALLGMLTAIKAHAPGFLSGSAWLTYGRVRPASANALVYGFVLQAGLGIALWMICRLGRSLAHGVHMITGAALFWNVGVALGIAGILAGGSTGHEWLEMPGKATPMLFSGFVLVGIWTLITLHNRQERGLYVSQWFLLTALLWFPWIYSTAQLLLVWHPVRGIMQTVIGGWYAHNLFELCLAPFGLASIFYFLPKLLGRPLHSRGLALFGFWTLVLFGGWISVHPGLPAPNWMSGVSSVARVFLLIPTLAIALNWYGTISGQWAWARWDWPLKFVVVGAACYLGAALLETLGFLPALSRVTFFTLFDQGVNQLRLHGFLAMALAGAIYYIAPRVAGANWPSARLIQVHFWCATIGTAFIVLALVIGGVVQGAGINQAQTDFLVVVRKTLPFLGTATLGATFLLVGYLVFFIHLVQLLMTNCGCAALWPFGPASAGLNGRAQR